VADACTATIVPGLGQGANGAEVPDIHLALACDFRVADSTAKLGIPSAKLSIVYGVKSVQRLFAIVGIANAKRILYSAERYKAAHSLRIGLVDEVRDNAFGAAIEFAQALARNAPLSIAGAKFMLNGLSAGEGALDVATAQRLVDEAADSDDFREGRRAFAEKRAPQFRGH
jgi:enoyl-CoA hydratase/carnithine racemase